MKPEKRPASKKPKPRKTKAQIAVGEMHRIERAMKAASTQNDAPIGHEQKMEMERAERLVKKYPIPPSINRLFDIEKVNEYAKTSFDPAYLKLRKVELNHIKAMRNKYLLIGILIGIGIGYGLHSALTWV